MSVRRQGVTRSEFGRRAKVVSGFVLTRSNGPVQAPDRSYNLAIDFLQRTQDHLIARAPLNGAGPYAAAIDSLAVGSRVGCRSTFSLAAAAVTDSEVYQGNFERSLPLERFSRERDEVEGDDARPARFDSRRDGQRRPVGER